MKLTTKQKLLSGFAVLLIVLNASCKKTTTIDTHLKPITVTISKTSSPTTYSFTVTNQLNVVVLSASNQSGSNVYTNSVTSGDIIRVNYTFSTPGQQVGLGLIGINIDGLTRFTGNGSGTTSITVQ